MKTVYVHSFESFGTVDGPGLRFVIFLQGCPMRCLYCHNPDTWQINTGKPYTSDQIVKEVNKYRRYLKKGGVTVSGGEPLVQIDFVIELFTKLQKEGYHTALDTSGITFSEAQKEKFAALLAVTNLVLLDLKQIDNAKHKLLTGHENTAPLKFAQYVSASKTPLWIRHVLVPGYTDNEENLIALANFIKTLATVEKVEVLPYHTLGVSKYKEMGISYPLDGVNEPSQDSVKRAEEILIEGKY